MVPRHGTQRDPDPLDGGVDNLIRIIKNGKNDKKKKNVMNARHIFLFFITFQPDYSYLGGE